jgi:predicted NAD/FAD-dependent oxidoreductase
MQTSRDEASGSPRPAPDDRSVGIVGAGVSGLTAAHLLAQRGLAVRVFDKARGVGGRTSVRRSDDLRFDHGAQYFTVSDERFAPSVEAWRRAGIVAKWDGRIVVIEDGQVRASPSQTRYVGVPGMNAITKHLASSLEVTTQTRIAAMQRRSHQWLLRDDSGHDVGCFDTVIVALPAAQAADLLTGLPEFAAQARACRFSPCWSVMAAFDRCPEVPFDAAFVHEGPLSWIARNSSKPGRPQAECWVLHASPEWSAAHIEDAPEAVCRDVLAALQQIAGFAGARPIHTAAHRWRYALPAEPLSVGCLWDEEAQVAVCGDWCQGPRIEGAFLSGVAAAERTGGLRGCWNPEPKLGG